MFSVDITSEEVEKLKDTNGDIRFHKVLEWCLPRFGKDDDQILWDWQAECMNNYMAYIIKDQQYKPKYYKPSDRVIITAVITSADSMVVCLGGLYVEVNPSMIYGVHTVPSKQRAQ